MLLIAAAQSAQFRLLVHAEGGRLIARRERVVAVMQWRTKVMLPEMR
jgi:hypothetical protein